MPISMIIPLGITVNGYSAFTDEEKTEAVKQNFKMLLLTRPGEYTMLPEFGVGLPNYLFHLDTTFPDQEVISRIYAQTAEYMPYIILKEVSVNPTAESVDNNAIGVTVKYSLSDSATTDILNLTVTL
jgi:phage baseplate assembly protein W